MELNGKVVLITGSSSGIGQATAYKFAKEGAKIIINYHENKSGAEETLTEIKKLGSEGIIIQADLSIEVDIKRLFDESLNAFEAIDVLINNAAYPGEKVPYFEATQKDLIELFNLNIINAMLCSKYVIEIMKKQSSGKIINTSSIKGWEYGGGSVAYAVSKAAINSFTKTLAKQTAKDNILVNAVAPGYVKTRVYDNQPVEKIKSWLDGTYLKKWVTLEEIADAFVFLAKNDAMTGQVIYVDAGFTLK